MKLASAAHCRLAAETARLKREWSELKLETMEKRALTDGDFQTLAEYNLCRQNIMRVDRGPHRQDARTIYAYTESLRARLPVKISTFTKETTEAVLTLSRHLEPYHLTDWHFKAANTSFPKGKKGEEVSRAARHLFKKLDHDFMAISSTLTGRRQNDQKDNGMDLDWGLFEKPRLENWHSDGTGKGLSGSLSLIGRINLPPEFKDKDGKAFQADNNSVYAFATNYTDKNGQVMTGNIHRSSKVQTKTHSLFLRRVVAGA